jgi:hypothetical protein
VRRERGGGVVELIDLYAMTASRSRLKRPDNSQPMIPTASRWAKWSSNPPAPAGTSSRRLPAEECTSTPRTTKLAG